MNLALIVCDYFCFSQQRLLTSCEQVSLRLHNFDFRLASEAEAAEILATHQPLFLPLIALGAHAIVGVPSVDDLEQWVLEHVT